MGWEGKGEERGGVGKERGGVSEERVGVGGALTVLVTLPSCD